MTADNQPEGRTVIVEETQAFTLYELCRATGAAPDDLIAWVAEGILNPMASAPAEWRFSGNSLSRARRAAHLTRDLELNPAGVAMVLDLLDQIASLTAKLRRLEQG